MSLQYGSVTNINGSDILAIQSVDVRWRMFRLLEIHSNNDSIKSSNYQHICFLLFHFI